MYCVLGGVCEGITTYPATIIIASHHNTVIPLYRNELTGISAVHIERHIEQRRWKCRQKHGAQRRNKTRNWVNSGLLVRDLKKIKRLVLATPMSCRVQNETSQIVVDLIEQILKACLAQELSRRTKLFPCESCCWAGNVLVESQGGALVEDRAPSKVRQLLL